MNLTSLIDAVAQDTNLSKKDSEAAIKSVFDNISKTLAAGERFSLLGFGSFEVKHRAAREGRNPSTGDVIQIAACNAPTFKAGKQLKEAVNS